MAGAVHGGAEAYFVRLVAALARAGLDQHVICRPAPARLAALAAAGVPTTTARFGGPLDLVTPFAVRRCLARTRPTLVVTWMTRATVHVPRGAYVHMARLGGYYDLARYQRCDHLMVNTRALRAWAIAGGWSADRVHHVPNFADAVVQAPVARADLETPADAPVILALGRLHPNKAFDVLIEALVELPRAVLWLAGEGPLRVPLEDLARRRGVAPRVRFLGWRDDAAALLAAADVLACPSRHEPLGNVVLEAWAHGVPVVAARATGPAELIRDGVDGLLVETEDVHALAGALGRVIENRPLAMALVKAGQEAYARDYAEPVVVARTLDLFKAVV
jgi:glycosyltransferase involved in cell wall biosynthesis